MKPKKLLLIFAGLIVLAVLVCVASSMIPRMMGQNLAAALPPSATPVSAEVSVRARGKVEPAQSTTLSFDVNGSVAEWLVGEGDTVKAGDVLGRLDTADLDMALREAQLELETAKLRLTQAEQDLTQRRAEAELSLQVAEARLAQAKMRYPSLVAASVRLETALDAEDYAQDEYNKSLDREWEREEDRDRYRKGVEQAADDRKIAEAEYAAVQKEQAANAQEVSVLENELARAQLQVTQLEQGADATLAQDIARAELRVQKAQADLALAALVAPFDGTVVELHYRAGDAVQMGSPALVLADLLTLHVETTDLDEWSMTHIAVGDAAQISFTAFDDKVLDGHVSEIALRGEPLSAGDVVYRTVIALDELDPDLRWGMTVRVTIPLTEAQ